MRASSALMKAMSKPALWATSGASSEELEELVDDVLEERLVLQEIAGQAVHRYGVAVDVALGIEIAVKLAAGRDAVDDLDAAELDQAIPVGVVEARGLRVDDDLAQHLPVPGNTRAPLWLPLSARGKGNVPSHAQYLAYAAAGRPFSDSTIRST